MNISLKIIYYLKDDASSVLCFRHATLAALSGSDIVTEVDDFNGEYDSRNTDCHICLSDTFNSVFKKEEPYHQNDKEDEEEQLQETWVPEYKVGQEIYIVKHNHRYNNKPVLVSSINSNNTYQVEFPNGHSDSFDERDLDEEPDTFSMTKRQLEKYNKTKNINQKGFNIRRKN